MPQHFIQDPSLPQGFSWTFHQRFWRRVDKNGSTPTHRPDLGRCWEWTGWIDPSLGYGQLGVGHRGTDKIRSHVAGWLLQRGSLPAAGLCVCHHCDNRICVNADHLWLGTHLENRLDCIKKGRSNCGRGERAGNAKLTWDMVREIRAFHQLGMSNGQIAKLYPVDRSVIWNIVHNRAWVTSSPVVQLMTVG